MVDYRHNNVLGVYESNVEVSPIPLFTEDTPLYYYYFKFEKGMTVL